MRRDKKINKSFKFMRWNVSRLLSCKILDRADQKVPDSRVLSC